MLKVVSVCGAQGEGKTTVLEEIKNRGYYVVERKTSRSILAELGMTLEEVNKYPPLTKYFQEKIIERHASSFLFAKDMANLGRLNIIKDDVIFVERSFADIFTYCLMAIGSFNDYNQYVNEYYERCKKYQNSYSAVIALSGRVTEDIEAESDGVRSVNKHFIRAVDSTIDYYCKAMAGDNYYKISAVDVDTRCSQIIEIASSVEAVKP